MDSEYVESIKKTKLALNTVSPTFCLAKWTMSTIHLQQGETHSCYHPWTHKIPLKEISEDPSALHNTEFKKQQRKKMLDGERPKECQYCWNIEDLKKDHISDRMIHSNQSWSKIDFKKVSSSSWSKNINPRHLEISFDSVCQLKCIYCNPTVSTKWLEEVVEHGGYKTSTKFNDYVKSGDRQATLDKINNKSSNPYVDAFWRWWPDLYKSLHVFKITGGEPLLCKDTFRVLDYVSNNPHPNLNLIINSNLSVSDALIDKLILNINSLSENISSLTVFASIDTHGIQAEYIRTGLDYARFMKNINRLLSECSKCNIAFTVTYNALSVPRLELLLNEILLLRKKYSSENNKRVYFDTPYLRYPDHLSIQLLDESFDVYFENQLAFMKQHTHLVYGFEELEIMKIQRVYDWKKSGLPAEAKETFKKDFYIYFKEHDKRRKTNFKESFPELENFYLSAEALHANA
ncbi:MAG: twitch domain-containing radical SAM protein [Pseudobdellovibrio sp.]